MRPLYAAANAEFFSKIRVTEGTNKGARRVVLSSIDHMVGLKDGERYCVQQFGTLDQARMKYNELKTKILKGEFYALNIVDGVWLNRTEVLRCIDKIFDEHEAQLKAKDERIKELEALKKCEGW